MKITTNAAWIAIGFNCLLAVIGVLQASDWVHVAGPASAGTIISALSVVNMVLHAITPAGPAAPPK